MTEEQALQVLQELLSRGNYSVDPDLVRGCYEVQRQFQFDRDREIPMDRMRRLVEAEVVRQMGTALAQDGEK